MRKLWMSDIHGRFDEMADVLLAADYDCDKDYLVIGGDMIDRGPDSVQVLDLARSLQHAHPTRVTVLSGNHEEMYGLWLLEKISDNMYFQNGGKATIESIENSIYSQEEYDKLMAWMLKLPHTYEDDEYFYVHAGLDPNLPMDLQGGDNFLWERDKFLSGDKQKILNLTKGKKVVHGHTPRAVVVDDGARINCDLGMRGVVLVDLTNKKYYQHENGPNPDVVVYDIKQRPGKEDATRGKTSQPV